MIGRIPAIDCQVHPADKRNLVINAHDLLVMRCIDGMALVEFDANARMLAPAISEKKRDRGSRGMDRRFAPYQYAHVKIGAVVDQ